MTTAETAKPASNVSKVKNDIIRFVPRQRVEHIVLMVLFIVLSVTGLAQRYSSAGWAEWIIINVGGIEFLRLIHRITAMVFVLQFVYHIVFVSVGYFTRHARLTMVKSPTETKTMW